MFWQYIWGWLWYSQIPQQLHSTLSKISQFGSIHYEVFFYNIILWIKASILNHNLKWYFLLDHHCKLQSETFDTLIFVRNVWSSCRVQVQAKQLLVSTKIYLSNSTSICFNRFDWHLKSNRWVWNYILIWWELLQEEMHAFFRSSKFWEFNQRGNGNIYLWPQMIRIVLFQGNIPVRYKSCWTLLIHH